MIKNPDKELKNIAKERISILFEQADKIFSKSPKLANRYIELARKIAMKARYKMPSLFKRKFCKHCYHFLVSGKNARIRTREGKLVIYCLDCKKYTRIPLK
ncbi:MAG: ribonuclease P protein component 4 [Candidatus Woesearchaeota archaeon]